MALALQEGFGAIVAKSLATVIWNQGLLRPAEVLVHPLWWVLWAATILLATLSMVFLKLVFARYEATVALPIEYGTVHAAQILGADQRPTPGPTLAAPLSLGGAFGGAFVWCPWLSLGELLLRVPAGCATLTLTTRARTPQLVASSSRSGRQCRSLSSC